MTTAAFTLGGFHLFFLPFITIQKKSVGKVEFYFLTFSTFLTLISLAIDMPNEDNYDNESGSDSDNDGTRR